MKRKPVVYIKALCTLQKNEKNSSLNLDDTSNLKQSVRVCVCVWGEGVLVLISMYSTESFKLVRE